MRGEKQSKLICMNAEEEEQHCHLSAESTIIVFTLGMSTPFSITVVAISTSAYDTKAYN